MREAADVLPRLLGEVRGQLANVPDRRKHPRIGCELPISLYPLHSDGGIDEAASRSVPSTPRSVAWAFTPASR